MCLLIQINVYSCVPVCRHQCTAFSVIISGQEILSGRGVTEQQLGHCQQLADLTPLIAKLGFCSDVDLPFWAG
jgi:hypothetical protein